MRLKTGLTALLLIGLPALAAPFAYITNQGSHDVSVIDLATQQVVATVPVGPLAGRRGGVQPRRQSVRLQPRQQDDLGDRHAQAGGWWPRCRRATARWASMRRPTGTSLYAADWYRDRLMVFDTRRGAADVVEDRRGQGAGRRGRGGVTATPSSLPSATTTAWPMVDVRAAARALARRVGTHPFALLLDAPRQRLYALNV